MDLLPYANHPTMTVAEFDRGVHKAHLEGCRVVPSGVAGVVFVTSGTRPGISYRVTRRSCTCPAGQQGRPCKHVALAVFVADICGGVSRPAAVNNVRFIHTRRLGTAETTEPKPAA